MVLDLMSALWDGVVNLGNHIFELFTKTGAIPILIAFSITGLFVSMVVLNRVGLLSKVGKSDSARNKNKGE